MKLLFYFTAKYLEIRYLYLQVFNGLKLTFMTQKIEKFIPLSLEYILIVFSYLQYFPAWKYLKSIWSLYNIDSSNFKNVFIKIVFSLFVEHFFKTLLGCPFGGTCLQPVIHVMKTLRRPYSSKLKVMRLFRPDFDA